jgi:CBS domain-containing protein
MPMRNLSVLRAKRLGVYTIGPDASLIDTACQIRDHNVSALVVTGAEGYLAGVISRPDTVRACLQRRDWQTLRVCDCMSADVVTVELDDPMLRVVAVERCGSKLKPLAVL